jgi:hypothetical protein
MDITVYPSGIGDLIGFLDFMFSLLFSCSQRPLNYLALKYFGFESTCWRWLQKRVMRTKFDIYVFITCIYLKSCFCLVHFNRKGLYDELAMIAEMDQAETGLQVNTCNKHVDIKFSAHDAFLQSPSASTQFFGIEMFYLIYVY